MGGSFLHKDIYIYSNCKRVARVRIETFGKKQVNLSCHQTMEDNQAFYFERQKMTFRIHELGCKIEWNQWCGKVAVLHFT